MQKNSQMIQLVTGGDMSGNITSPAMSIKMYDNISVQCTFTGSPTGTFAVEVSNDNSNWTALASPPAAAAGSGATTRGVYTSVPDQWMRVKFVFSSGSGSLNVFVSGKGL